MNEARKMNLKIKCETTVTHKYCVDLGSCCIKTNELEDTLNESSFDNYITGDFAVHIFNGLYVVNYCTCDAYEAEEERTYEIKCFIEKCVKCLLGQEMCTAL